MPKPITQRKPQAARQVPQLDLRRQYEPLRAELMGAVERVLTSQQFILGEEVAAFERECAAWLGGCHAVGCASGTDAIWLALAACGVVPGDYVLTTPFSFFASTSAILRAGARPLMADIDPVTFNLDPHDAELRLRQARPTTLRALLPVHLYGQCVDMDSWAQVAAEFNLQIVEDAAQAIGATWRGARAGTLGAAAAFSFYPTKNLSAAGDAGMVTTRDARVAERVRSLRNHGGRERYRHDEVGWNSRLDALQAAVLRVKLPHVERWNQQRNARAAEYARLLHEAGLAGNEVTGATPIVPPPAAQEAFHVYHQYVVRANRRNELRKFLAERGVGSEVYYPVPLHFQPALTWLGYSAGAFPEAERAAAEVLALPIFPELTSDEQEYVVDAIAEFYS
jgi:dTDP-4-amino-4,6-dideoxygalactose transaminase